MNREAKKYRRKVRKLLLCGFRRRKELMAQMERPMEAFLADCPNAKFAQLEAALGSPNEMAASLMENVPLREQKIADITKIAIRAAAVACFVAVTIYVYFWKQKPLDIRIVEESIVYVDRTTQETIEEVNVTP